MISDKENQGKFHLLAILLIPVNMVTIFLSTGTFWWFRILIPVLSAGIIYVIFRKKSS